MSYNIKKWNSDPLATIQDGTVDQSLDLKLIGKNYAGYGEIQNENFVYLLENFARNIAPPNAITGQLWYDSQNKKLKILVPTTGAGSTWKTVSGAAYGTEPESPTPGDLWFNVAKNQLNIRVGGTVEDWLVVGPQNAGQFTTQMVSRTVADNLGGTHAIIAATVNGVVNFVISEDEFDLDIVNSNITGFTDVNSRKIKRGITFPNVDATGVSQTGNYRVWGTASNALRFGGKLPTDYLSPTNSILTLPYTVKVNADEGISVGANDDLKVEIIANQPVISARLGTQRITFSVKSGTTPVYPLVIDSTSVRPDNSNPQFRFDLGSVAHKWQTVYATTFDGTATQANTLRVGTAYLQASFNSVNASDTLVARKRNNDGTSTIFATTFDGNATTASALKTPVNINGIPFDGSAPITIVDPGKLPLIGGTLTGDLTLKGAPTADLHAATKLYVDGKFGVGGILGIASGGTNANTVAGARANLNVPRTDGIGATTNSTWNINIAPSVSAISVTTATAQVAGPVTGTGTTIRVTDADVTGSNAISYTTPGYDMISVTSQDMTTGVKIFTIDKVTGYQVNTRINAFTQAGKSLQGVVTAVDNIGLTITITVDNVIGSGSGVTGPWRFAGLGDTWRVGATITGTAITGTVVITAIAKNTPSAGQTTLTVAYTSQTVSPASNVTITATDPGDGLGGNAATATKAKNLSGGVIGSIPYQVAADTTAYLATGANTAGYLLTSTGSTPQWTLPSSLSIGTANQILVADRPTETGVYYPVFALGGLPGTGSAARSLYADQNALTYDTNVNKLTIGDNINGYGTVIAKTNGHVLAPDGTIILNQGTGNGANATFSGKAAYADALKQARNIKLTGILQGNQNFDGSGNIEISASFAAGFQLSGNNLTGVNYVGQLTAGTYITLNEGLLGYVPGSGDNVTIGLNASSSNSPSTVVVRSDQGSFGGNIITGNLFSGVANEAYFADLAEKYLPDAEYEPGTVVAVGGEKEVTASTYGDRALGVISTNPAYMMNKDLEGGVYVALKGRVPCKVIGAVRKGQRLVAANDGYAVAAVPHASDVFAIALETSSDTGVKVIEVAVL
jgi:hypothetical protein